MKCCIEVKQDKSPLSQAIKGSFVQKLELFVYCDEQMTLASTD